MRATRLRELLMALIPFLLGVDLIFWVVFIPVGVRGDADFAMFYTAGAMVRAGHSDQLYDYEIESRFQHELVSRTPAPYTHLPYEAVAFAPFSLVNYRTAYWLFLLANLLFTGLALVLSNTGGRDWLSRCVLISFFPLSAAIADGQDSIVLLLVVTVACWLFTRSRPLSAGVILAFGLFRFQLILPIAALMLVWRRWRLAAGFAISTIAVLAVSAIAGGFQQLNVYAMRLASLGGVTGSTAGYAISTSQLRRMVSLRALFGNALASGPLARVLTLAVSVALLIWTALQGRRLAARQQFVLAIGFSVLVSYHLFVYDLALLLVPLAAALELALKRDSRYAQTAVLLLLVAVPLGVLWRPFLLALPLSAFLILLARALREPDQNRNFFPSEVRAEEQAVSPA